MRGGERRREGEREGRREGEGGRERERERERGWVIVVIALKRTTDKRDRRETCSDKLVRRSFAFDVTSPKDNTFCFVV